MKRVRCAAVGRNHIAESLERRRLLSGLLGTFPASVNAMLSSIDGSMESISGDLFVLPVVGKNAKEIDKIRRVFNQEVRDPVMSAINTLDNLPSLVTSVIQEQVFNALSGAGILGEANNTPGITKDDVLVNFAGLDDFSIGVNLRKQFNVPIPAADLTVGLSSLPLGIRSTEGANLSLTFAYTNFRFGRAGGGFFFDTSADRELSFTLAARLPQKTTVLLGIVAGTATNNTVGDNFSGTLSADLSGTSVQSPRLGGSANFNLGIETVGVGITQELLPKIKTDLTLSWPFGSVNASGPESSAADLLGSYGNFGAPSLAFNNLSIGLGSMLSQIIKPIASTLSSVTRPLQDAMDKLYSPLPGISDLSHYLGGPDITLAEISAFNQAIPTGPAKLPPEFDNLVNLTTKLRTFSRIINDLNSVGAMANAFVNLGSFPISGPSAGSLLINSFGDKLLNKLGGALDIPWSDLIALGTNLTYEQVVTLATNTAIDIAGQVAGDEVADLLTQMRDQLIPTAPDGVSFKYPIVEDTRGQLVGALLGKDVEFVEMHARWSEDFGDAIALPPLPVLPQVLQITPSLNPEIEFRVGLDSYGLKKAIVAATSSNIDPLSAFAVHAPSSVYVMSDSRFNFDASIAAAVGIGFPGFFIGPSVGLSGNLLVQMDVPNPNQARKIRVFDPDAEPASKLGSSIFRVSGSIKASAGVTTTIGVEPFAVTLSKNWAEATLFSFDTYPKAADNIGRISNPFVAQGPPTLARFETPGVLTLLAGSEARRNARALAVSDVNERFSISQYVNDSNQRVTVVNAYGLEQEFLGVSSIYVEADDGNDNITIDKSVQVTAIVHGGAGNDQIAIHSAGEMQFYGGLGDDTLIGQTGAGDVVMLGEGGNDSLYVRSGTSSNATRSIALFGGDNDDDITVGGVYPSNASVSVNGGAGADRMTVTVTGKPFLLAWPAPQDVAVNGGLPGENDVVVWRDLPALNTTQLVPVPLIANHSFLVTDASIIRNTANAYARVNYSNVARVELNSNSGNDSLMVTASNRDITMSMGAGDDRFINGGSGNVLRVFGDAGNDLFSIWGGQAFRPQGVNQLFGGDGIGDSIEYDVSAPGNTSSSWNVSNSSVTVGVNGGAPQAPNLASITLDGFEGVRFTGTSGADQVIVSGSIPFNLFINTLGGDDNVLFNEARNPFQVQVNNNIGVDLGGQPGDLFQALTDLDQNRFVIDAEGFKASRDNDLALLRTLRVTPLLGVGTFNLVTSNIDDVIDIDAGFDANRSYTIDALGGADAITLRNFGGLQRPSTISGGAGYDSLEFDDSLIATARGYSLLPGVIAPQAALGLPSVPLSFDAAEALVVRTGSANDSFRLSGAAATPSLTTLSILTGAGDDWVFGDSTVAGDFPWFISSVNTGPGDDRLSLRNVGTSAAATWTFTPTNITGGSGLIPVNLFHAEAERFDLDGGSGPDVMNVHATNADQKITLRGGAGNDTYNTFDTAARRTDAIRSLITINDTSGTDSLIADNAGKPDTGGLGDWLHITEGVLSHTTNDRFFAPGGRVVHSGIDAIGVVTSQANDYVVVAPSAAYSVQVSDSTIVSSTQDNITYSLAGVADPQFVNTVFGKRLNSSNRLLVDANGFEFYNSDAEVPTVATPPAPVFDAPAFYLNVGFDVPMDIYTFGSGEAFTVQNLTTGQTLPSGAMLAADSGVNGFFITFPGYANGLPPDGRYRITLNADHVRSLNYNPLAASQSFDFAVLRGDANNDAVVNFDDLLALAANYNQSSRSFSQGDFTYDGTVNFDDLLVLASRYNYALPLAGPSSLIAPPDFAGDVAPLDDDDDDNAGPSLDELLS